jgi:hypothetical protein
MTEQLVDPALTAGLRDLIARYSLALTGSTPRR